MTFVFFYFPFGREKKENKDFISCVTVKTMSGGLRLSPSRAPLYTYILRAQEDPYYIDTCGPSVAPLPIFLYVRIYICVYNRVILKNFFKKDSI